MSSVGVLIEKKSKYFCEKREKKSKCPKKNFQSVKKGGEKKYKCEISGVRKKMKGKYREKIKVFFGSVVCALHTLGRHVVKHG